MCQEFDFEYFRAAKLTRVGVHNPGFNHWQLFLCPEDNYQNIASRIRQYDSNLSLHHPFIVPYKQQDRRHSSLFLDAMSDRREGSFPPLGFMELEDAETGELFVVNTSDAEFRSNFEDRATRLRRNLEQNFRRSRVDLIDIQTDVPYVQPLIHFFKERERRFR
mgnify:CR=1 FL=1